MPIQPIEQASLLIFLLVSILLIRIFTASLYVIFQVAAAILLAPQNSIRAFLGSYGEAKNSLFLSFWRINLWIHPRFLLFPLSLVDFSNGPLLARNRQILILLAGPLGLLWSSGMAFLLLFSGLDWGSISVPLLLFVALFGLMSVLQILRVMLAKIETIPWRNYGLVMSDGERLGLLLRHGNQAPQVQRVVWHWVKDDYKAVWEATKPLLESKSTHQDVYEYAIYACLSEGKIAEGIDLHERMAAQKPPDTTELVMLSYLYERNNEPEKAIETVQSALNRTPGFHLALNQRAWLLMGNGGQEAALKDLNRAVKSDPDFAAARSNRARIYLERKELEKAEKDLEVAMQHGPLNSLTYETLAGLYRARGLEEEAEMALATVSILQGKPAQSPGK